MTRSAIVFAAVLVLAAGAPAFAEDPPDKLEVDLVRWDASDAEARWVLVRSTGHEESWVPFLAERKEHDLLEWIALAEPTKGALDALFEANAPHWPRVALWSLGASDTHKIGGARALLVDKRPGLTLDWLERHSVATADAKGKKLLADLREKAPAREDASKMLPPLVPEQVLAVLSVGATSVEDLGDARQAHPGRVYASQVARAIDVLAASSLRGEPWKGRLLALLKSPNRDVRRRAALAFSHFPPADVPLPELLDRVDDPQEDAGVRAAAAVALGRSSQPKAYLTLLRLAGDSRHPAWRAALSSLGDVGDGFAIQHLKDAPLAQVERLALESTLRKIAIRWSQEIDDPAALAQRVPALLGRAAWADLMCDPTEATLIPWTQALLAEHAGKESVRLVLERVLTEDLPELSGSATMGNVRDRAREYARAALKR